MLQQKGYSDQVHGTLSVPGNLKVRTIELAKASDRFITKVINPTIIYNGKE
jgi:hypothetical protein